MVRRYEISDADWKRIELLLKGKVGDVGRSGNDNRLFINAVVWMARSGAAWRDLPERYGPWNSVYRRFRRWAESGHWQAIFEALQDPDLDWAMVDSTARRTATVRAHQQAAGQKKVRPLPRPSDVAGVG